MLITANVLGRVANNRIHVLVKDQINCVFHYFTAALLYFLNTEQAGAGQAGCARDLQ